MLPYCLNFLNSTILCDRKATAIGVSKSVFLFFPNVNLLIKILIAIWSPFLPSWNWYPFVGWERQNRCHDVCLPPIQKTCEQCWASHGNLWSAKKHNFCWAHCSIPTKVLFSLVSKIVDAWKKNFKFKKGKSWFMHIVQTLFCFYALIFLYTTSNAISIWSCAKQQDICLTNVQ